MADDSEDDWRNLSEIDSQEDFSGDDDSDQESVVEDADTENISFLWEHRWAVLIAVIATAITQIHLQTQNYDLWYPFFRQEVVRQKFLDDYRRTSHLRISEQDSRSTFPPAELSPMTFHLPKKHLMTLAQIMAADVLQDDNYTQVVVDEDVAAQFVVGSQLRHLQQALSEQSQQLYASASTFVYQTPSFESMYPSSLEQSPGQATGMLQRHKASAKPREPAYLSFTSFGIKIVNLSPDPVLLFWDGVRNQQRKLVTEIPPYQSVGTATTPGQSFSVTPIINSEHALQRWTVTADDPVLYYEPALPDDVDTSLAYHLQLLNRDFARDYLIATQRSWLAHFPRPPPVHSLWPAAYVGQGHSVGDWILNVASVTPRVFSIDKFLSVDECNALIDLAHGRLEPSTLMNIGRDAATRGSSNAWLERDATTRYLYERAAKLLRMDVHLLTRPIHDSVEAYSHSVAESLQVLRYETGQHYEPHHDFTYPPIDHRYQPTRYATLLLYLNDDYEGGATVFPRAVNVHHHEGLSIQPKQGRAVLFYNMLPDGNMDDLSQHGSEPVAQGTKYLATLWAWDPMIN